MRTQGGVAIYKPRRESSEGPALLDVCPGQRQSSSSRCGCAASDSQICSVLGMRMFHTSLARSLCAPSSCGSHDSAFSWELFLCPRGRQASGQVLTIAC